MLFNIVIGGIGSGKSELIESKIEQSISCKRNALVIVPERFSHIEERTLCNKLGGLGLNGVEVSTFSKLSARLCKNNEYLMPSGREMLVLKAARSCQMEGDGIFEGAYERSGFIGQLSAAISELKRSLVTPNMLKDYSGGGLLQRKTTALGAIYEEYNSLVEGKYSDPDENMSLLAQGIENTDSFINTDVYIDGFTDFIPSHYEVIEALIKKCCTVTVVLTLNDNALRNSDGIFTPVLSSYSKLNSIAAGLGIKCGIERTEGEYKYIKAEDIKYFLKNYDEYTDIAIAPKCENISLKTFESRHSEVLYLAGRIMHEVRDNGLRFRDIGVIVGNSDAYLHIIDSVFSSFGIAYSADSKLLAVEHPVIRLVLSIFKVITENWSYSSVFEYLRSGFLYQRVNDKIVPYDSRSIDKLEIYVKSRGIRGKSVWLSEEPWKASKARIFDEVTGGRGQEQDMDELNRIRLELMKPFVSFTEKIRGKQRVAALAEALFEFLEEICLYDGLSIEKKRFEEQNMLDEAIRIGTVWDIILQTLDQCVMVSGNEYMSREDFSRLLEAGFSKCSIDIVPSGADRVAVAAADVNRPVRVRALFVLGAIRGELPSEVSDFGILTAADRTRLQEAGIDGLPDSVSRSALAEFNLFSSLTAGYERLYVTYPRHNEEGVKVVPAPLVGELLRFFDEKALSGENTDWEDIFSSKNTAYNTITARLSGDISEKERDVWDSLWNEVKPSGNEHTLNGYSPINSDYSIFDGVEAVRLDLLGEIEKERNKSGLIRPETARSLYGERSFSISALQKYNKCPFSYFADYGLGLKGEEEHKVRASDIGSMVHWAVCEYCRIVQEGAETHAGKKARWLKLDKNSSDEIISELAEKIAEITKSANPDYTPERIELICAKSAQTLKRSAEIIRLSLTEGEFVAYEFEKPFRFTLENKKGSIELSGIIDRADIAEVEDGKRLRVIDYKTGLQSFSVAGIYNKTDLQLIVYALAAEEMYRQDNAKVAAVMYDKITEELNKTELGLGVAIASSPLDGIIVCDDDKNADEEILIHSKELAENGIKSRFLPLSTNKKGGLRKSGSVLSRSKFNILTKYVAKTAIETKNNIYDGKISVYPLGEGDNSACKWCDYSQICLHKKSRDGIREQFTSSVKAWKQLEAEDNADE